MPGRRLPPPEGGRKMHARWASPREKQSGHAASQVLCRGSARRARRRREGVSFSDPASRWKADHGGNSWQSQHIPLILAGPGVKSGAASKAPVQLDDVAPTVLANMGVAPVGMEGHVLTDALDDVATREKRARATEMKKLRPMVASLLKHEREPAG